MLIAQLHIACLCLLAKSPKSEKVDLAEKNSLPYLANYAILPIDGETEAKRGNNEPLIDVVVQQIRSPARKHSLYPGK